MYALYKTQVLTTFQNKWNKIKHTDKNEITSLFFPFDGIFTANYNITIVFQPFNRIQPFKINSLKFIDTVPSKCCTS